jgi:hypothetical protein
MENDDRKAPGSKRKFFVAGFLSGAVSLLVLSQAWKPLTKEGVKAGTKGWRKLREISQKAMEDLQDAVAEANEELSQEEREES